MANVLLFASLVYYLIRARAVPVVLGEASTVTLIVTSCKRPTSLKSLLGSLFKFNTYKFRAVLIA